MLSFLPYLNYIHVAGYLIPVIMVFYMITVLVYMLVLTAEVKRLSLNIFTVSVIFLLYFTFANIFSRALFILSRIYLHHDFENQSKVFYFYTAQKISFGVLLGLFLALILGTYLRGQKKDRYKYADAFFLSYCAGLFIMRLGDAFTRYHPGKITNSFFGVYYLGAYRHEPSFYEAIILLLIFLFSWVIRKRLKIPGFLALMMLALTSLARFLTDFFRNNDLPLANTEHSNAFVSSNYHLWIGLTLNQIAYIVLFFFASAGMLYLIKKSRFIL